MLGPANVGGGVGRRAGPVFGVALAPVGIQPVVAGTLGHAHHRVGQEQAVFGIESGVDEGIDGLGDGLFHPAQRGAQLEVVRSIAPVEEAEGRLAVDHEFEVGGKAQLDLLAGAVCRGGRLDDACPPARV